MCLKKEVFMFRLSDRFISTLPQRLIVIMFTVPSIFFATSTTNHNAQSAIPSSQLMVALAARDLPPAKINRLSSLYLPMYCAAVITLPLWVAVAMLLIG